MNTRINNALILLKDGASYQVGSLHLRMKDEKTLLVFGETNYSDLSFLTKKKALDGLNELKFIFGSILENSKDFSAFVKNKEIEYILMESLEKGGDAICSEQNNVITWLMNWES
jgi:hypothetical protein